VGILDFRRVIPTRYAGCLFRSRLEARWAVFFDALEVRWQYETEGFILPSGYYLPDFWLADERLWLEVKGAEPEEDELDRWLEFAEAADWDWGSMAEEDPPSMLTTSHFRTSGAAALCLPSVISRIPAITDPERRNLCMCSATATTSGLDVLRVGRSARSSMGSPTDCAASARLAEITTAAMTI
jgi:hypothetical protein